MEVLRDQRVLVHLAAQAERDLGRAHRQFVAFELHLTAREVERGDDLLVGRSRGMRQERFLEAPLDEMEIVVPDEHHRALAQGRHRFVRRAGLVDADAHFVRVGQEVRVEERGVVCVDGSGCGGKRLIALAVLGVAIARGQRGGRAHRRAPAVERVEPRESEPGLVPQKDQVGFDRQALFHDPCRVVHVSVERAVGQIDDLDARPGCPAPGSRRALF